MPTRRATWLLLVAAVSGMVAYGAAWVALGQATSGVDRLFESATIFGFSEPEGAAGRALAVAKVSALVFALTAVGGLVLELSPTVRDGLLRARFGLLRGVLRRPPAVVIGLGWVDGPLASQLCGEKRPVTAVVVDEDSPRARAARQDGVRVVVGDAAEDATRARLGLRHAREVYVATGDDAQNIEIAGGLLRDAEASRLGADTDTPRLHAYVHLDDPALRATAARECLFEAPARSPLRIEAFGASELASRQLLLDPVLGIARRPDTVPAAGEVPHLLVFGFGALGQTVVLDAARALHFPDGYRPRVTVFGDRRMDWDRFLARFPGLSPPDLDLTHNDFLDLPDPDAWWTRAGRPVDPALRKPATVSVLGDDGTARTEKPVVRPVEYAAHVEFVDLTGGAIGPETVDAVWRRVVPAKGRAVRATMVFCFAEERRALEASLRVRRALFDRLDESGQAAVPPLPIYVHLPTEDGLEELLDVGTGAETDWNETRRALAARYPIRPFGQQRDVMSVADVTQSEVRRRSRTIRASHRQLRGETESHPDFGTSNDAASRFTHVRLDALGLEVSETRLSRKDAAARGRRPEPVLWGLMAPDVLTHPTYTRLMEDAARRGDGGVQATDLPPRWFDLENDPEAAEQRLLERLALLDRIRVPDVPLRREDRTETPFEEGCRRSVEAMKGAVERWCEQAVQRFERDVRAASGDPAVASAMEHNRWMAERLIAGWQFGARDNVHRRRMTLVPTEDLTRDELAYDRIHLPRLILEEGPEWRAPGTNPDVPERPARYLYAR